ncbi:uncharacterized protein RCO7_09220 [Rhynchosporium graminicola]|uniref:Extracellular membrane protein CFEM domain-containing protein n=1 Tax=Rhynchosporium graminicola TaxID=2792576 RepID=A0A1E1L5G4_9HELO|nr:uncharacterized protein RCO7_09220 [Rhynchosporium commune]
MQLISILLIGLSASLAKADWGTNGFRGKNWGNWGGKGGVGPECAKSCFSSAFPDQSTAWSSACASQTVIDKCISSACPTASAQYTSASSIRSQWCASYSSCSTAADSCTTAWPWWNSADGGHGWVGGWGGKGPGGVFTVTVTSGQATRGLQTDETAPEATNGAGALVIAALGAFMVL